MVNFFLLLVVDQLHEFELGVWKVIFTHLLCILFAAGGDGIQELNKRFRNIPTFARRTIQKFACKVSAMKRLAAQDFEDLLQVLRYASLRKFAARASQQSCTQPTI
ncbi:hypothetical protein M404DRAFT_35147 [Pisolithus tinctorius Marx 270]|uniref:Uncharacterized protein n=1 Tax=Pisolithus tinctorius Marx 270 TaxID=870435 RepID=A0A0C3IBF0_PISTI|nr:hypothetical protein M404DRAFT_35147 [Pisolithus tinctorius Marx 270]